METPEMFEKSKIPPQFLSEDPYEVLGVPETAIPKEIFAAQFDLIKKYLSLVVKDNNSIAQEIINLINSAYKSIIKSKINDETKKSGIKSHNSLKGIDINSEEDFLDFLSGGLEMFSLYINEVKSRGVTQQKIEDLLKTPQAKKIINDDFNLYLEKGNPINTLENYVKEWKEIGIDIKNHLDLDLIGI